MTRCAPYPLCWQVYRFDGFQMRIPLPLQVVDYRRDHLPDPHTVVSPDPAIDWSTVDTCGVVEDFPPRNTPPGGTGRAVAPVLSAIINQGRK